MRKKIHKIINKKNSPWYKVIISCNMKTDINIVKTAYALAILEDMPAYHVCKLFE